MDKNYFSNVEAKKHTLKIEDRESVQIEGVNKIDSFDSQEFLIDTVMGYVHIKGKDLVLGKMDNENGEVIIKGIVDSVSYLDSSSKGQTKEKLFKKIFK